MLAALIIATAAVSASLIGYGAYWLITDARERRRDAEMADAWLKAHKQAIAAERYRYDDEGRPL